MSDSLTGLYNRHYFGHTIAPDIKSAMRHHKQIGLIMFDLDYFKSINDEYGHAIGDHILNELGNYLSLITSDKLCPIRWGGEEFLVVLFGASRDESIALANELREGITKLRDTSMAYTCSFGTTQIKEDETLREAIDRVDQIMYVAKNSGRNCVRVDIPRTKPVAVPTAQGSSIVLIGMPGAGKSTVGVVLAKGMTMGFVDSDILLQAHLGEGLQNYLDAHGYIALRAREHEMLAGLSLTQAKLVISTGGSSVYSNEMDRLAQESHIVYLRAKLETVESRIGQWNNRGVACAKGTSLADVYEERGPLYESVATITIDTDNLNLAQTVAAVQKAINERTT